MTALLLILTFIAALIAHKPFVLLFSLFVIAMVLSLSFHKPLPEPTIF